MRRIQLVPLARENERKGRRGERLENGLRRGTGRAGGGSWSSTTGFRTPQALSPPAAPLLSPSLCQVLMDFPAVARSQWTFWRHSENQFPLIIGPLLHLPGPPALTLSHHCHIFTYPPNPGSPPVLGISKISLKAVSRLTGHWWEVSFPLLLPPPVADVGGRLRSGGEHPGTWMRPDPLEPSWSKDRAI